MGRHVISVTLTGNNADLKRALASTERDLSRLSKGITTFGKQSDLTKALKANEREINRFGAAVRRLNPDLEGLGTELETLRRRSAIRIKTFYKLEETRRGLARFSGALGLVSAGLLTYKFAAGFAIAASAALSGAVVGVAGGGLAGAFALLWFQTDKAKEEMKALGTYIRNDLINRTMKPFYDEVARMPGVLRDSYNQAKPQFEKLGEALKPLMRQFNDALPGLIKQVAGLFTTVAEASKPFFRSLLNGLPDVIDGIDRFFKAFKRNGDPGVIRDVLRDLGDAIAWIGEKLSQLDGDDWQKFSDLVARVVPEILEHLGQLYDFVGRVDEAIKRMTGGRHGIEVLAGGFLTLWAAMKFGAPALRLMNDVWNTVITKRTETAIAARKLTQSEEAIAKATGVTLVPMENAATKTSLWAKALDKVKSGIKGLTFLKFFKVAGIIGVVVSAFQAWKWVIDEINTEGSKLNQWWKDLTSSSQWNDMVASFNAFKDAISEGLATLRVEWDAAWQELESAGVIDAMKAVSGAIGDVALVILGGTFRSAFSFLAATLKIATAGAKGFAEVVKAIRTVVSQWINVTRGIIDGLKELFGQSTETKEGVSANLNAIQGPFKALAKVSEFVSNAFNTWKQHVISITENAKQKLVSIWNTIRERLRAIVEGIRDRIRGVWDSIRDRVRDINNAIRDKVRDIWDGIRDRVRDINDSIRERVRNTWDAIRDKVREINDALRDKIRDIWDGMRDRIRDIMNSVREHVREAWDAIRERVREVNDAIRDKVREIWDSVRDNIREKVSAAVDIVREKMGNMLEAVRSRAASFADAGRALIQGLISGITSMAQSAVNAVVSVVENAKAAARRLLGINSPSKVFRGYGTNIGQGLVIGIEGSKNDVSKSARYLLNGVTDAMSPMGDLSALVNVDSAGLSALWASEVEAAKRATDQLTLIWSAWGQEYQRILTNAGVRTNSVALQPATGTINETRNYYLTVNSNSPNVGREIVNEIQKYERSNGSSWRR